MRQEFSRRTRREALERSGGLCEASGERYGLPKDKRCNWDLGYGVEFDHDLECADGGDNSLENCRAVCPRCHVNKTGRSKGEREHHNRTRDKHDGTWKRKSRPMPGTKASGLRKRMNGKVERR